MDSIRELTNYVEPSKPWLEIPSAERWAEVIGDYQIRCAKSSRA